MRLLLAVLLISAGATVGGGCTVDDGLIDNKKCAPDAPLDKQCVKGYEPDQTPEGCFCRPIGASSPLRTLTPPAHPTVKPLPQLDPSRRLLRRLGVLED